MNATLANHPELFSEASYVSSWFKILFVVCFGGEGVCLRECLNFLSGSAGFVIVLTIQALILFVLALRNTAFS